MCKFTKCLSLTLVLIGALNWGLVGLFGINLVTMLLGEGTIWTKIIYVLVGISAIIYGALVYICSRKEEC